MEKLTLKMKKGFIIAGLSALCVLLVVGIFAVLGEGTDKTKLPATSQDTNNPVSVGEIQNDKVNEPSVTVQEVTPKETQDTNTLKPNDIQLTEIPVRPQPPEKPDTAVDSDKPHDIPKDTNLTNPDKKPTVTVKPVEPTKPKEDKPTGGETNSKGEVYVPGFGWVKNSGSNEEIKSQSDGDWNKQIGDMN
ncbi:DUF6550 family protein [Desulfitibacter alkalitolerans]|uniref:DUF6550 family protein n=1 Tax=Desulfitibacter alkalitolerans TaxID=264641 RepID=UPI000686055F|nr:DUF6550 family protein [Desulfitibacter alkalitolerans]